MTDLRQAALLAWQALDHYRSSEDYQPTPASLAIDALRQALNQLPDTTKMIDTGTDRGAWSDVPDATKWVDELRGDEWTPDDMAYRPGGLSLENPPIIRFGDGLHFVDELSTPTNLYPPALPKREWSEKNILIGSKYRRSRTEGAGMKTLREAAQQALGALDAVTYDEDGYCLDPGNEDVIDALRQALAEPPKREWQGLTDEDFAGLTIQQIFAAKFAEAKLKEKNG